MAISRFEDQARREAELTIRSKSTLSALFTEPSLINGRWNSEVADMFWLRPGEAFEFGAAPPEIDAFMSPALAMFAEQSVQQRAMMYQKQGWPVPLAFKQANADLDPLIQKFFRVVKIDWNWTYPDGSGEEGGWSWEITGRSYMDVRSAPAVLSDDVLTGIGRA